MMRAFFVICVTAILLLPSAALAGGGFELTPFVGYQFGGDIETSYQGIYNDISVNSGENFGMAASFDLNPETQIELLYSTQDTSADARRFDGSFGLTIDYWQISGIYNFNPFDDVRPYVVFGLGATSLRPDGFSNETKFSGNFGGGVKVFLNDNIGLRLDGRLYATYISSTTAYCDPYWCYGYNNSLYQFNVSAGLIVRFGN
ncbi:MAG: hypothetical protein DRH08_13460 [Deltaproteobacteria bacterium]|nr:MAG: hypothetical protein DRH08_13460 [Deltaproteobacteria bacterium]